MKENLRSICGNEDWLAVGFGFAIIAAALTRILPKVPKIGKWTDNPLAVFDVLSIFFHLCEHTEHI